MSFRRMMIVLALGDHGKFKVSDGKMSAIDVTMHEGEEDGEFKEGGGEAEFETMPRCTRWWSKRKEYATDMNDEFTENDTVSRGARRGF